MRFSQSCVVAVVCCMAAFTAHAAIVITGTRVIYPAESREVNVRLSNVENRPVLVQAWLDEGNPAASPDQIQVPFVLLPSVFRVEPRRGQSLRIMFTGADLPQDRESVYWLNVLEIPPKPAHAEDRNMIQLAFRTRIKLFYRPTGLYDDPTSVRSQLKWTFASNDSGERVLRALRGAPGVHSARYAQLAGGEKSDAANNALLVERLNAHADRRAYYYCVLALVRHADDPEPLIAEGRWHGEVLDAPRGDNGFGYDPYFFIPELGATAAQLDPAVKNASSHRAIALRQLLARLTEDA